MKRINVLDIFSSGHLQMEMQIKYEKSKTVSATSAVNSVIKMEFCELFYCVEK